MKLVAYKIGLNDLLMTTIESTALAEYEEEHEALIELAQDLLSIYQCKERYEVYDLLRDTFSSPYSSFCIPNSIHESITEDWEECSDDETFRFAFIVDISNTLIEDNHQPIVISDEDILI